MKTFTITCFTFGFKYPKKTILEVTGDTPVQAFLNGIAEFGISKFKGDCFVISEKDSLQEIVLNKNSLNLGIQIVEGALLEN